MQKKIEKISSEILDDLAEELELEFPFYPNVVWVGKNKLKFEGLGMPKCYRDDFETAQQHKDAIKSIASFYFAGAGTILLYSYDLGVLS